MKDYFYGVTETLTPRPIILPVLVWIGIAIGVGCLVVGISGCATTGSDVYQICYVKVMGRTEDGTLVAAQTCMTPDAFAESQK
jgi:hypothetical protein